MAINPIDIYVGSRIQFRRISIGMSKKDLGRHLKLLSHEIEQLEMGETRIDADQLFQLAEILGVSVQYFFLKKDSRKMH